MDQLKVEYDLYDLYDRILDDVMVELTIGYDLPDIIANGTLPTNLKLLDVQFTPNALTYLTSAPFDLDRIRNEVREKFNQRFMDLDEAFIENVPDEIYKQFEHTYA